MINVSKIPRTTFVGKLLRLPLKLVPRGAVMRILQGPGRGLKWVKGSGNDSYWLGTYEADKQEAVGGALRKGMVFYDIGAHVGIFTLIAARRVGDDGLVVAFEPSERNFRYLERHIALNGFRNVLAKRGAVARESGSARFSEGENNAGGHLSDAGTTVETYSIDELVAQGLRKPDVVKIDVQGATLLVLGGMERTLRENDVKLFIAIDNASRAGLASFSKQDVHNFLKSVGYETTGTNGERIEPDRVEETNEISAYTSR